MKRCVALLLGLAAFGLQAGNADGDAVKTVLERVAVHADGALSAWQSAVGTAEWKAYRLDNGLGGDELRLKTTLPRRTVFAGSPLAGRALQLELSARALGLARVTVRSGSREIGCFEVDGGDGGSVEMTRRLDLDPAWLGEELTLRVENRGFRPARNAFWPERRRGEPEDGGWFALKSARFVVPGLEKQAGELQDWLDSFRCGLLVLQPELVRYTFTGKPYPIPDKRLTPPAEIARLTRVLAEAASVVDLAALEAGRWPELQRSLRASLKKAIPVRDYLRRFEIGLIGNAHIDIAWLWRMAETVEVAHNTFDTVIKNMSEYPELLYAQSQAVTYDWMEKRDPALFERIRSKVREGRWEIVGGMWVEPDCNLISGESWARQLLLGKNYFRDKFGVDVRIGWNPDSFGYNWNMPQIYSQAGIVSFITQKLWWNDTTVFPHYLFWWQGVDGTKLLTYLPPASYATELHLEETLKSIGSYEATCGRNKSLILYGLGDHGGGPNREILDRVRRFNQLPMAPRFTHLRPSDYIGEISRNRTSDLPVVNDELYLEYHQGTFTTQAAIKKNNRRSESMLATAEKASALSAMSGATAYPAESLRRDWKSVLTHQFHDILPGSSITPVYRDALEQYAKTQRRLERTTRIALDGIAAAADTGKIAGRPLLVFNSLSWARDDAVTIALPGTSGPALRLVDETCAEVPLEVQTDEENDARRITFVASGVPALGYRVYWLQEGPASGSVPVMQATATVLENERHRLELDPKTGNICSLLDKRLNREMVAPGEQANRLWVYEDRPEDWDAWNIGYTGRGWMLDKADAVELESVSPVRAVLRVKKSFLGLSKDREYPTPDFPSSTFVQHITLWRGLERVDVRTEADWWEEHLSLKACFPLGVTSERATYEIPFAAIQRTTRSETLWEKARYEVPALRWADLSDQAGGLSLLNDSKYGYDIHGHTMKLSLLRSPTYPDPMADRGRHEFTYSFYTHAGAWNGGDTVRQAIELNQPLQAIWAERHGGALPPVHGFVAVTGRHAVLDTIKQAEDGRGWVLRLYDALGTGGSATLEFDRPVRQAVTCDLLERDAKPLAPAGRKLELEFRPFEIKSVRVFFE
jgi:alpha-mannosidase